MGGVLLAFGRYDSADSHKFVPFPSSRNVKSFALYCPASTARREFHCDYQCGMAQFSLRAGGSTNETQAFEGASQDRPRMNDVF
jgi:hypothetical protein